MKNAKTVLLIIFASFLIPTTTLAQVIHKDDLEHLVAILKTSPPDIPGNFPKDSLYVRNKPLEDHFTDFFVKKPDNLDQLYPLVDEEGNINSRLNLGPDYSHLRTLQFYDRQKMIVLLHNQRFESGTYYLTTWIVEGDSLRFDKLYNNPLGGGIGNLRIDSNYKSDGDGNRFFVLQKITPDMGYEGGSYHLFQLSRYGDFFELWQSEYYSDLQSNTGAEHIVMYQFLSGTDFLVQEYWYDLTKKRDDSSARPRSTLERKLTDSKLQLLNLDDLKKIGY